MTSPQRMSFTDQLGRDIKIQQPLKRIVSLVPSQTELLYDLQLDEEIVGITKFCVHPESWFKSKRKIGGTKDFKPEEIRKLQPDLILANKEENNEESLSLLMEEFPVWVSDISGYSSALEMISAVGTLTGKKEKAEQLIKEIEANFFTLKQFTAANSGKAPHVLYFIWKEPWMVAGKNTFIQDMLRHCGLNPMITAPRYPEISLNDIRDLQPDYIFLSSEPYPFNKDHKDLFSGILPPERIILVDGEFFSWYGSRLRMAASYFISLVESLPVI